MTNRRATEQHIERLIADVKRLDAEADRIEAKIQGLAHDPHAKSAYIDQLREDQARTRDKAERYTAQVSELRRMLASVPS